MLIVLTLLLLYAIEKKNLSKSMLALVIFIDLFFFWKLSETKLFLTRSELVGESVHYAIPPNSRIVDLSNKINSSNYLAQNYSNILGYSVLVPKNVVENLHNAGFASTRNAVLLPDINSADSEQLKSMGIEFVINNSGSVEKIGGSIFEKDYKLNYRSHDVFIISPVNESEESLDINAKLNYFYGWAVKSDNKITLGKPLPNGFTKFKNVPKASKNEVFYLPLPLLYGLIISAVLVIPTMYLKSLYDKDE